MPISKQDSRPEKRFTFSVTLAMSSDANEWDAYAEMLGVMRLAGHVAATVARPDGSIVRAPGELCCWYHQTGGRQDVSCDGAAYVKGGS